MTKQKRQKQVEKMIYTSLNNSFQSQLDLVFMIIKDVESNNWQVYPVNNFKYFVKRETQMTLPIFIKNTALV